MRWVVDGAAVDAKLVYRVMRKRSGSVTGPLCRCVLT
jgi:hypothetical protein